MNRKFLRLDEVERIYGLERETARKLARKFGVKAGRRLLIPVEALEAYLYGRGHTAEGPEEEGPKGGAGNGA